jgi:hypothetical protein
MFVISSASDSNGKPITIDRDDNTSKPLWHRSSHPVGHRREWYGDRLVCISHNNGINIHWWKLYDAVDYSDKKILHAGKEYYHRL